MAVERHVEASLEPVRHAVGPLGHAVERLMGDDSARKRRRLQARWREVVVQRQVEHADRRESAVIDLDLVSLGERRFCRGQSRDHPHTEHDCHTSHDKFLRMNTLRPSFQLQVFSSPWPRPRGWIPGPLGTSDPDRPRVTYDFRDREAREPLVIGGDDEPRRARRARARKHILVCSTRSRPSARARSDRRARTSTISGALRGVSGSAGAVLPSRCGGRISGPACRCCRDAPRRS